MELKKKKESTIKHSSTQMTIVIIFPVSQGCVRNKLNNETGALNPCNTPQEGQGKDSS